MKVNQGIKPEELLKKANLYSVPVDVDKLAEFLSINVDKSFSFEKTHCGEISLTKDGSVNVWINNITSPNRQRFTLAHEIGHYVNDLIPALEKHQEQEFIDDETTLKRSGLQLRAEYQANDYAAKLLMPKELVIESAQVVIDQIKARTGNEQVARSEFVRAMASFFHVSEQAMEIRLKVVGILS